MNKTLKYLLMIPIFGTIMNYLIIGVENKRIQNFSVKNVFLHMMGLAFIFFISVLTISLIYRLTNLYTDIETAQQYFLIVSFIVGGWLMGIPIVSYYKKHEFKDINT